jgi:hypothetical protein
MSEQHRLDRAVVPAELVVQPDEPTVGNPLLMALGSGAGHPEPTR